MDLLEGLVVPASGTIPQRLRHRCAPYNCVPTDFFALPFALGAGTTSGVSRKGF
jgi:hypothetical protein